jgi:large subunit ribosomal protein L22
MTDVKAQLNGLRIAPRKVRALVNLIRSKDVDVAVDQLQQFIRRGSPALIKLIQSAVANAENNFKLKRDGLYIKDMQVDEGIKLKRFMPKGFGRAGAIEKKTSRVRLVLDQRAPKEEPIIAKS